MELDKAGSLSFARLMDVALYSHHGYYSQRVRIGKAEADFYTATQSELFALTVARYIEAQAAKWGHRDLIQIVEVGGGQGELAKGISRALAASRQIPRVSYYIQEKSAYLREKQQAELSPLQDEADFPVTFSWTDVDKSLPTIVLANEVLDALPVERIRKTKDGWLRLEGRLRDNELDWFWAKAPDSLAQLADAFVNCPVGMEAEIGEQCDSLMQSVLVGYTGPLQALWFDYGISREEWETGIRPEGTLRAYRRHELVDPLVYLTEADITADVNWSQVETEAQKCGASQVELVSQGKFLMDNGILDLTIQRQQEAADILEGNRFVQQFKQLALPGGMGDRFSVLICEF